MMQDLPEFERPRERCLRAGADSLSLRECLAVILGSGPKGIGCLGLASQVLRISSGHVEEDTDVERAFFLSMEGPGGVGFESVLSQVSGLGPAGQARLLACFEVARRYLNFRCGIESPENHSIHERNGRLKISETSLAYGALNGITKVFRTASREWLGFVPIYPQGKLGKFCLVERGVRTHVNTDPVELFSKLLPLRASGFFLFHNHPTGHMIASPQDLKLTQKVSALSRQLGIPLLGHWIVGPTGEYWISNDD